MTKTAIALFALLAALVAIVVFAHNVELRSAALIFMVIGYPCILGIVIQVTELNRHD